MVNSCFFNLCVQTRIACHPCIILSPTETITVNISLDRLLGGAQPTKGCHAFMEKLIQVGDAVL